jgi:hypothetical protein
MRRQMRLGQLQKQRSSENIEKVHGTLLMNTLADTFSMLLKF